VALGTSIKEAGEQIAEAGAKIEAGLPDAELTVDLHDLNSIIEKLKETIASGLKALEETKAA